MPLEILNLFFVPMVGFTLYARRKGIRAPSFHALCLYALFVVGNIPAVCALIFCVRQTGRDVILASRTYTLLGTAASFIVFVLAVLFTECLSLSWHIQAKPEEKE